MVISDLVGVEVGLGWLKSGKTGIEGSHNDSGSGVECQRSGQFGLLGAYDGF